MCFSWVGNKINLRRLATRRVLRLDSQHVVQLNKFKVNSWAYIKGDHVSRSTQVGKQSRHYLNILATKTHEFFLFLPYTTCLPWTCPIILLGQAWCFRCPWGAGILRSLMDLMGRKLQKLLVFIDFPWFSYQLSETNMAMFTAEILVEHQEIRQTLKPESLWSIPMLLNPQWRGHCHLQPGMGRRLRGCQVRAPGPL